MGSGRHAWWGLPSQRVGQQPLGSVCIQGGVAWPVRASPLSDGMSGSVLLTSVS